MHLLHQRPLAGILLRNERAGMRVEKAASFSLLVCRREGPHLPAPLDQIENLLIHLDRLLRSIAFSDLCCIGVCVGPRLHHQEARTSDMKPEISPGSEAAADVTIIVLEKTSYSITPKLYTSTFSLYL